LDPGAPVDGAAYANHRCAGRARGAIDLMSVADPGERGKEGS
jgi:hypothetical protein